MKDPKFIEILWLNANQCFLALYGGKPFGFGSEDRIMFDKQYLEKELSENNLRRDKDGKIFAIRECNE